MLPEDKKSDHVGDLERRLYSSDIKRMPRRRFGMLHPVRHDVSKEWEGIHDAHNDQREFITKTSMFKKVFIFSIIFFIIALLFGAYKFFGNSNSVSIDNVSIEVLGNTFASGGDELPLEVEIGNKNAVALEYSDLIIEYPKGSDLAGDTVRQRISLGVIDSGKVVHERVLVTLFGEQGSTKDIKLSLQFRVKDSNAVFQKTRSYGVIINSAPAVLTIDAPKTVNPNQDLTFAINLTPNSSKSISNVLVKVDYPTGFQFDRSDPMPSYMSNVWRIDTLDPGKPVQIKIKGIVLGENGEERSFRVYTGISSNNDKNILGVIFASSLYTVSIDRPFIEAKLVINGVRDQDTIIASPKNIIRAEINWANNLPTKIVNAEISVQLSGAVLDESSVQASNGFYNSLDNTISWNRDTIPEFNALSSGQTGTLGFTFSSLSLIKSDRTLYSDPSIIIGVSIKGQQPTDGGGQQDINSFQKKTVKLTTDFQVAGQILRTIGPFTNTGPLPPKAEVKSTYTVKWSLTTSANPVENVSVHTTMPSYVHFLNNISPATENLAINPLTGVLVWKVGSLAKGTGIISNPKEVYFQIEFLPSISQVDSAPILLNEIRAEGQDTYTGANLESQWASLTTRASNDPTYVGGSETVGK